MIESLESNDSVVLIKSRRKASRATSLLRHPVLFFVALFLIVGNLSRIVSLPGFRDNVPLFSMTLYAVCLIYAAFHRKTLRFALRPWPVYLVILLSSLYGVMANGFQLSAVLYSVRLVLLLFSAMVVGRLLFTLTEYRVKRVIDYILTIYMLVFIAGILIYLLFPDSTVFWNFLAQYGVVFNGDPHQRRFYSTYFDPNYYSAIICLPLFLSLITYQETSRGKYLVCLGLFALSLVLAGSRSGLGTLLLMSLVYLVEQLTRLPLIKLRRRTLYAVIAGFLILLVSYPLYSNNLSTLISRIVGISDDPSAFSRVTTFEYGLGLLQASPFLGVGYNYLTQMMTDFQVFSVDASILATAINFGIPLTLMALILLAGCTWLLFKRSKGMQEGMLLLRRTILYFLAYLWIVILFASVFNNVLYYEYWLFPTSFLGSYLWLTAEKHRKQKLQQKNALASN